MSRTSHQTAGTALIINPAFNFIRYYLTRTRTSKRKKNQITSFGVAICKRSKTRSRTIWVWYIDLYTCTYLIQCGSDKRQRCGVILLVFLGFNQVVIGTDNNLYEWIKLGVYNQSHDTRRTNRQKNSRRISRNHQVPSIRSHYQNMSRQLDNEAQPILHIAAADRASVSNKPQMNWKTRTPSVAVALTASTAIDAAAAVAQETCRQWPLTC